MDCINALGSENGFAIDKQVVAIFVAADADEMFAVKGAMEIVGGPIGFFAIDDEGVLVPGVSAQTGEVGEVFAVGGDERVDRACGAAAARAEIAGLFLAIHPEFVACETGLGEEDVLAVLTGELHPNVRITRVAGDARNGPDRTSHGEVQDVLVIFVEDPFLADAGHVREMAAVLAEEDRARLIHLLLYAYGKGLHRARVDVRDAGRDNFVHPGTRGAIDDDHHPAALATDRRQMAALQADHVLGVLYDRGDPLLVHFRIGPRPSANGQAPPKNRRTLRNKGTHLRL